MENIWKLLFFLLLFAPPAFAEVSISVGGPDGSRKLFENEDKAYEYLARNLHSKVDGRYVLTVNRGNDDTRSTQIDKTGDCVEVNYPSGSKTLTVDAYLLENARLAGQIRYKACLGIINGYQVGLKMYAGEHAGRYPRTLQELVPKYVARLSSCPTGPDYKYWSDGKKFHVVCQGDHSSVGVARGLPAIDSKDGLKK